MAQPIEIPMRSDNPCERTLHGALPRWLTINNPSPIPKRPNPKLNIAIREKDKLHGRAARHGVLGIECEKNLRIYRSVVAYPLIVKSIDVHLSYFQAIITGILQGISELFPISSLGHSVLVPAWIGGSWRAFLNDEASGESPYLLMIIALHVASSLVLLWYFRDRWILLIRAFASSLTKRSGHTAPERLIWKILLASIPVGILGVLFQDQVGALFSDPFAVGGFLFLNGALLAGVEFYKKRRIRLELNDSEEVGNGQALAIGVAQSAALFPGISRFGITMSAGLARGLSHSAASDFAFLIATPVIVGAGVLKLPKLFNPEISHILGPVIAGSIVSAICTYFSIAFLVRWFKTHTLYPFAIYCLIVGALSFWRFG